MSFIQEQQTKCYDNKNAVSFRLTEGVLLANVLMSLRLVLINRRVLLIWALTLWFAA